MEAEKKNFHVGLGLAFFGFAGGAVISLLLYLYPSMPRSVAFALLAFFLVLMTAGTVMIFAPHLSVRWAQVVKRRRLLNGPIIGMSLSVILFLVCAAWYFYPKEPPPADNTKIAIAKINGLEEYYAYSLNLLTRVIKLPKTTSFEQYKIIDVEIDRWSFNLETYVAANYGSFEKSRLFDKSVDSMIQPVPDNTYPQQYAQDRSANIAALLTIRKALLGFIEEKKALVKEY